MTTVAPVPTARPVPGPCLTTGPWSGVVIGTVFAASIVLFLVGLITLAS